MLKARVLHQMPCNRLNLLRSDLNTRKDSKGAGLVAHQLQSLKMLALKLLYIDFICVNTTIYA